MTQKAVIIGMNNPHSDNPEHALAPFPARVAGWNLWRMLADVSPGVSRLQYMRGFERINLLTAREWCPIEARRQSAGLLECLRGRTVLVAGRSTSNVLWLPAQTELKWAEARGVKYCYLPHPSGLNRWYNDKVNRLAVGYRLEELLTKTACEDSTLGVV